MTRDERKNNIIAYVGMLDIKELKGMNEEELKKLIVRDAALMDEEQKIFTLENIEEIIVEIIEEGKELKC